MRSFQPKRELKSIMHSKPVLGFLGILVLIFAWGVIGFMGKMQVTIENRKLAENKVAELEKQKEVFSSGIDKLNTAEGIEESIRDKFGLAKEGEGLIVIVDDKNAPEASNMREEGFFSFLFFWNNWFK